MNLCILIPVITGIISALLGYLLGKLLTSDNSADLEVWKTRYMALEGELAKCRAEVGAMEGNQLMGVAFDAKMARDVFGKAIKENDLKIIEGIGPAIEELFKNHGVTTWKALAMTTVEKCQEILDSEGERFRVHDPETWHEQARLAYQGKWEKLHEWQQQLKGGKL